MKELKPSPFYSRDKFKTNARYLVVLYSRHNVVKSMNIQEKFMEMKDFM